MTTNTLPLARPNVALPAALRQCALKNECLSAPAHVVPNSRGFVKLFSSGVSALSGSRSANPSVADSHAHSTDGAVTDNAPEWCAVPYRRLQQAQNISRSHCNLLSKLSSRHEND